MAFHHRRLQVHLNGGAGSNPVVAGHFFCLRFWKTEPNQLVTLKVGWISANLSLSNHFVMAKCVMVGMGCYSGLLKEPVIGN